MCGWGWSGVVCVCVWRGGELEGRVALNLSGFHDRCHSRSHIHETGPPVRWRLDYDRLLTRAGRHGAPLSQVAGAERFDLLLSSGRRRGQARRDEGGQGYLCPDSTTIPVKRYRHARV